MPVVERTRGLAVRQVERGDEWNALARRFAHVDVRQSWQWGELCARRGWQPLRLVVDFGGECVAAASVLLRRVPALGVVAYAPRGPLFDPARDDVPKAVAALARAVRERTGASFLRASPSATGVAITPLEQGGFRQLPDLWSVWNTPRNVMTLDIVPDEQALLGAMARKRRQHISTAAKKHVTADVARGLAGLRTVHALLAEHGAREGFPVAAWQHYEALHELFDAEQALGFVLGRVRGEIVGAALGLRFGAGACLMYAVTTPAARSLPVGDLMHWQWIRWARAAGCRTIDFGATCTGIPPVPSHPNYGIYRFKTELGARLTMTTGYYDTVYAPLRYRAARALERRLLPQARRAAIAVQRALRGPQDEAAPAPAATHEAVTCA